MFDECFHYIAMKKSINIALKCSKVTGHTKSKPPLKAPLACIRPLPNFSITLLSNASPTADVIDAVARAVHGSV